MPPILTGFGHINGKCAQMSKIHKNVLCNQRYRIFLFPRNSLIFAIFGQKSTEWVKIVFFFFHCCFFFSAQKSCESVKFVFFSHCFFFFFFSYIGKVYSPLTHSILEAGKKKQWKKNTIFTHSVDFCPKSAKIKLFPGNKKIRYLCPFTPKK